MENKPASKAHMAWWGLGTRRRGGDWGRGGVVGIGDEAEWWGQGGAATAIGGDAAAQRRCSTMVGGAEARRRRSGDAVGKERGGAAARLGRR